MNGRKARQFTGGDTFNIYEVAFYKKHQNIHLNIDITSKWMYYLTHGSTVLPIKADRPGAKK
ncbi:hypothetical protein ACTVPQ_24685 [Serratia bockelmannii]|uniref:hypothetical protein n=1 Tax=Serratia bockelmannii TaxID=2703793 RepID=UPI003FA69E88